MLQRTNETKSFACYVIPQSKKNIIKITVCNLNNYKKEYLQTHA